MTAGRVDTASAGATAAVNCLQQVPPGEDERSSGVRGVSVAAGMQGRRKIAHAFGGSDQVTALADRLLFLMIKVEPGGWCSGESQ